MAKIIIHVDLNAFFATAEQIRRPEYAGKPVIVGGLGPRGVVSTCSYEARSYGVRSAMPIGEARMLCPNGIFLPGDYAYYEMLSRSFFGYLKNYSSLVEAASIDEGFVDMTSLLAKEKDPMAKLVSLQQGLLKQIGLKCSIGVGPTKFLAKMASDMKKPMGITVIRRKDIKKMLYPLPIDNFFGIGKKTAAFLRSKGINTIGDFAYEITENEPDMRKYFKKRFDYYVESINGYGDDIVNPERPDPKSIGHSQTFMTDTDDYDEIKTVIESLSQEVSEGLIKEKKKCKRLVVNVKDYTFKASSKSSNLIEPVFEADDISKMAKKLFADNYSGKLIRLVGVTAGNLVPFKDRNAQMSLFEESDYEEDKTQVLIDSLNRKANKKVVMIASEALKKNGN
ncbi:MAG: DNA polymerase IV [Lachnospiraceae bacterium]|nr:DNA polymerase IV [Lachnospiraceae bacterium]